MTNANRKLLKLGLIGDNIAASKAPLLHRTAGDLCGVNVTYDRLVPRDMNMGFDALFDHARDSGYRGLNITYPYKEQATARVTVADPQVRAIGAINTVVFDPEGPQGFNTDYSGFMAAYRQVMGDRAPGTVCLMGAGGVGKAVAFGLLGLKSECIRCVDLDTHKAHALADALNQTGTGTRIELCDDPERAAKGADGLINCTPLGMVRIGGSPLNATAMAGASWAFDAVYTPINTPFLNDAGKADLTTISGYELFFGQGVDAWDIFAGLPLDHDTLRRALGSVDTLQHNPQ